MASGARQTRSVREGSHYCQIMDFPWSHYALANVATRSETKLELIRAGQGGLPCNWQLRMVLAP
jgi:hypothetical protein